MSTRLRILFIFALSLVAIVAGTLYSQAVTRKKVESSANNLKQWGLVFKVFANESKPPFYWPSLSSVPGQLMCDYRQVYPEYLSDLRICISPFSPGFDRYEAMNRADPADIVNDSSYVYLGYVLTSEEDVLTFVDVALKWIEGEGEMGKKIESEKGQTVYRLQDYQGPCIVATPADIKDIERWSAIKKDHVPVMLERREFFPDKRAHVLFMDGHVGRIAPGDNSLIDKIYEAIETLTSARDKKKSGLTQSQTSEFEAPILPQTGPNHL